VEVLESRRLLSVTINEFPLPDTANAGCTGITAGPDGNLWFTEAGLSGVSGSGNAIGQINPTSHVIKQFPLPTFNNSPQGIALGSDGNLWFTEPGVASVSGSGNKIGQINATSRVVTEFPLPTANSSPQGITAGPGNVLWFTEKLGNNIGLISPRNDHIDEFPLPTANSSPNGIATGSDGNLWFTELAGRIGEINPDTHVVTEFNLPTPGDVPTEITPGPDGNLWFTIQSFTTGSHGNIGVINPHTDAISEFPLVQGQEPVGIATGSDDNLWFTVVIQSLANGSPQIGQINLTTHAIATFMIPTVTSDPAGITSGPDSNLWFAESFANNIGQVVLGTQAPAPDLALSGSAPSSVTVGSNVTYNLTVTNNGTAAATGVTLTDTLPSGVKFISATGGISPVGEVLAFALGSLAAGASTIVTIVATPTAAGTLNDSADVGMDQGDPTPADNAVTRSTTVTTRARGDGPRITLVQRFGFHMRPTTLVLTFDEPLDPVRAQDVANYRIVALAYPRRAIRIGSALYDPATLTVTLTPEHRLNLHHRFRLTIKGTGPSGISDTSAKLLDGKQTGSPGSDFATTIVAADLAFTPKELMDPRLLNDIRSHWDPRRRTASV
jgi:virginiamycin B lyase